MSKKVKQLILDPELGRMAADLAGTSGVRLYHDHAMFKQPWANPTNFHVDNPYDPFYSHQAIMFWVALDDATIQNGCLYFLPGTHKTSGFEVGGSLGEVGIGELFREYPEWAEIEPYPAEMKAGDGVFISGMVAHAAGPNMTTHPRRAFAMLFMPEDATFNGKKSALPDEVYAKLKQVMCWQMISICHWFFHTEMGVHCQISLKSKTKYKEFPHVECKREWKNHRFVYGGIKLISYRLRW